jgi:hypothetical protein
MAKDGYKEGPSESWKEMEDIWQEFGEGYQSSKNHREDGGNPLGAQSEGLKLPWQKMATKRVLQSLGRRWKISGKSSGKVTKALKITNKMGETHWELKRSSR